MHFEVFGDEGDPELLWVMGWGNKAESRHERWFVDELVDAGYRVHTAEVPTNGTDFQGDYVGPLDVYRGSMGDHRIVSHSTGGLAVAHLRPREPTVYLSPWWGASDDLPWFAELLFKVPTSYPFIPSGEVTPDAIGGLATEEDMTGPDRLSPKWMGTMQSAQADLPPVKPEDHVFYTPEDQIVDPDAIEAHADEDQLHPYEGGHEFFSSENRDRILERVLDAIEDTWDAD
jgi:hypothetical protein